MFASTKLGAAKRRRTPSNCHSLSCEELESRYMPARFAWCPPDPADTDYRTNTNWAKEQLFPYRWVRVGGPGYEGPIEGPVSSSDIYFASTVPVYEEGPIATNVACTFNQTDGWEVHSITIASSCTAVITLESDLTVNGVTLPASAANNTESFVNMRSATIAGAGGKLVLDAGSVFNWGGARSAMSPWT